MYYTKRLFIMLLLVSCIFVLNGCENASQKTNIKLSPETTFSGSEYLYKSDMKQNPYETLCVPTQVEKLGEDYFIVDCYHSQIITSKSLDAPLTQWRQVTDQINMGHTIASDGYVYLCDDTENHRVLVMVKKDENFYITQEFENIGKRPHFTAYDAQGDRFLVLSSLTGEIYIFERKSGSYTVEHTKTCSIDGLKDIYIRSFTLIDGYMYLPAGNGNIYKVDLDKFKIKETYPLAATIAGPVQLVKIGNKYYLTVSTDYLVNKEAANIVAAERLEDFASPDTYYSVRDKFCMSGTPYVITQLEDTYVLCIHSDDGLECLWKFNTDSEGEIVNVNRILE